MVKDDFDQYVGSRHPPITPSDFHSHLDALREVYPGAFGEPVIYSLPQDVIPILKKSEFFNTKQVEAETVFTDYCDGNGAVGIRPPGFVNYPLLLVQKGSSLTPFPLVQKPGYEWINELNKYIPNLNSKISKVNERLLGVAGRLMTLPLFISELAELRKDYLGLSASDQEIWPLHPLRMGTNVDDSEVRINGEAIGFATTRTAFLARWGLASLVDWHLPFPQGPLFPNLHPDRAPALPQHGVRLIIPLHYPLQGDDDLLAEVKRMQKEAIKELNIPIDLAGLSNHKQYAQLFRLIHLEKVLRTRWNDDPPRGAVELIESAGEAYLNLSRDTVQKLRKSVNALSSGKKAKITRKG